MLASQIRQQAREALAGKWGNAALLTLSMGVILFLMNWILGFIVGLVPILSFLISIALLVIEIPISFGIIASFMKFKRNETVGYADFLTTAFSNIGNAWKVAWSIILKTLPWVIGMVVSIFLLSIGLTASIFTAFSSISTPAVASASTGFGILGLVGFVGYIVCLIFLIPKTFSYALSYFILFDHPEMSGKEIVEKSEQLMQGNRWRLFCLSFSFIGWAILASITLGIGYLWLAPYMITSMICFYENLNGGNTVVEATPNVEDNNNPIQGE